MVGKCEFLCMNKWNDASDYEAMIMSPLKYWLHPGSPQRRNSLKDISVFDQIESREKNGQALKSSDGTLARNMMEITQLLSLFHFLKPQDPENCQVPLQTKSAKLTQGKVVRIVLQSLRFRSPPLHPTPTPC